MKTADAVLVALIAGDGVIDKLELALAIPKSDRDFLAAYQTKAGAGNTRIDEDVHVADIYKRYVQFIQKQ